MSLGTLLPPAGQPTPADAEGGLDAGAAVTAVTAAAVTAAAAAAAAAAEVLPCQPCGTDAPGTAATSMAALGFGRYVMVVVLVKQQ